MRASVLALAALPFLLLASSSLADSSNLPSKLVPVGTQQSCPVALDLRHGYTPGQYRDAAPTPGGSPGQRLDLTIAYTAPADAHAASPGIDSIDATVWTNVPDSRFLELPAGEASVNTSPTRSYHVHLVRSIAPGQTAELSWRLPTLDPVSYLDVEQVHYAGGASRMLTAATCRFTVNPVTLIAAH